MEGMDSLVDGPLVYDDRVSPRAEAAPFTLASGSPTVYTLSEISTHTTPESLWTVVDDKVYNITEWQHLHPGGREAMVSVGGKDGSAAFHGKHPESYLNFMARFCIGVLSAPSANRSPVAPPTFQVADIAQQQHANRRDPRPVARPMSPPSSMLTQPSETHVQVTPTPTLEALPAATSALPPASITAPAGPAATPTPPSPPRGGGTPPPPPAPPNSAVKATNGHASPSPSYVNGRNGNEESSLIARINKDKSPPPPSMPPLSAPPSAVASTPLTPVANGRIPPSPLAPTPRVSRLGSGATPPSVAFVPIVASAPREEHDVPSSYHLPFPAAARVGRNTEQPAASTDGLREHVVSLFRRGPLGVWRSGGAAVALCAIILPRIIAAVGIWVVALYFVVAAGAGYAVHARVLPQRSAMGLVASPLLLWGMWAISPSLEEEGDDKPAAQGDADTVMGRASQESSSPAHVEVPSRITVTPSAAVEAVAEVAEDDSNEGDRGAIVAEGADTTHHESEDTDENPDVRVPGRPAPQAQPVRDTARMPVSPPIRNVEKGRHAAKDVNVARNGETVGSSQRTESVTRGNIGNTGISDDNHDDVTHHHHSREVRRHVPHVGALIIATSVSTVATTMFLLFLHRRFLHRGSSHVDPNRDTVQTEEDNSRYMQSREAAVAAVAKADLATAGAEAASRAVRSAEAQLAWLQHRVGALEAALEASTTLQRQHMLNEVQQQQQQFPRHRAVGGGPSMRDGSSHQTWDDQQQQQGRQSLVVALASPASPAAAGYVAGATPRTPLGAPNNLSVGGLLLAQQNAARGGRTPRESTPDPRGAGFQTPPHR